MITYRTLTDEDFSRIYRATHDAFSDYSVPYQTQPDGFFARNGDQSALPFVKADFAAANRVVFG